MSSFAKRGLLALAFVSNLVLCGTTLGGDVEVNSVDNKPAVVSTSVAQPAKAAQQSVAQARKAWNVQMLRLQFPKNGCFTATYPKIEWREVQCGRPSTHRNLVGD